MYVGIEDYVCLFFCVSSLTGLFHQSHRWFICASGLIMRRRGAYVER